MINKESRQKIKLLIPILAFVLFLFVSGCLEKKETAEKAKPAGENAKPAKKAPEPEEMVDLTFEPNPVQPDKALTIKVKIKELEDKKTLISGPLAMLYQKSKKVWVVIPGASSASHTSLPINEPVSGLEGTYFWYKAGDKVELKKSGPDEWQADCVAPTDECLYLAKVVIEAGGMKQEIENADWILKVFPEWWDKIKSFKTCEEAIEYDLNAGFKEDLKVDFKIEKIEEKELLPNDRRNNQFLKLYEVKFTLFKDTPVLPKGSHSHFFYLLRETPTGGWKVISSGTAP